MKIPEVPGLSFMNCHRLVYSCHSSSTWQAGCSLKAACQIGFNQGLINGRDSGKINGTRFRLMGGIVISLDNLIGLGFIGLTTAFMLVFALQDRRSKLPLRRIVAMERLARAVGLAVEDGRRVHISLGRGNFLDSHAASTLTNTALIKEIIKCSLGSDRPPAITSGDGTTTLLGMDALDSAQNIGFTTERMSARRSRLAGVTPMSYAAGTLTAFRNEQTSMMVAGGMLGAEIRLILDTAEDESVNILTASDSPIGQAVAFSSPGDVLIGEEVFAMPAYMNAGSMYSASLLAEDALRWLLILFLIIGAVLQGLGMSIL